MMKYLLVGLVVGIVLEIIKIIFKNYNVEEKEEQIPCVDFEQDFATMLLISALQEDEEFNENKATKKEYEDAINWETDCEYCGDYLENCECENIFESHQDIGINDYDKHGLALMTEKRLCDFDSFRC